MENKLRKIIIFGLICLSFLALGCGGGEKAKESVTIKVGATVMPHAEILEVVKPILAKEGVNLQIVEFSDYVKPNLALSDKEIDANYFQHLPYLDSFVKEHKLKLISFAKVHIEPMGIYSKKIKNLDELKTGDIITIPNDPTNGGRALLLLAKAKVIKLKENAGISATIQDIVDNPKKLVIRELEAAQLPRTIDDATISVINTNFALAAGFVPTKDALLLEAADSPYVNILVIRQGDEKRPELEKLARALNSPDVKKFIEDKYKGAVVPAF